MGDVHGDAGAAFLGPVAALVYAIGVVPRFALADLAVDDARRPPPPAPPAPSAQPVVRRHVAPARLWSSGVPPPHAGQEPMPDAPSRRKLVIEIDDV